MKITQSQIADDYPTLSLESHSWGPSPDVSQGLPRADTALCASTMMTRAAPVLREPTV